MAPTGARFESSTCGALPIHPNKEEAVMATTTDWPAREQSRQSETALWEALIPLSDNLPARAIGPFARLVSEALHDAYEAGHEAGHAQHRHHLPNRSH